MLEQELVSRRIKHCGKELLSASAFADKYNITSVTTYVRAKEHPYIYKIDKGVYIDEQALLQARELKWKVWLESHENYFQITEYISARQLGKLLSKYTGKPLHYWEVYMSVDLWSIGWQESSILNYRISEKLFMFHKLTNYIINKARRYNGITSR
jgi:hypothetical protein